MVVSQGPFDRSSSWWVLLTVQCRRCLDILPAQCDTFCRLAATTDAVAKAAEVSMSVSKPATINSRTLWLLHWVTGRRPYNSFCVRLMGHVSLSASHKSHRYDLNFFKADSSVSTFQPSPLRSAIALCSFTTASLAVGQATSTSAITPPA